ncbi:hypothetical protein QTL95_28220 [Rhizobium sp. S152]|uniref:hypothetical protein n=1 Tax=Rhizobium sp. S152 TaxID=3055038 RepID=UPI0025A963D2|nr:hypothetical protein [Rhizobium sp. S152]MDM9629774.1 hypothetical protein [Rhizobium sp. S152]
MPVVGSRFYNSPELGQAFQSLAGLFAPPSGSDLAGYATAREKNMVSDAYQRAGSVLNDPNSTDAQKDAAGVLAKLFGPGQGYRALTMDDATKRYGYDQQLAGTQYSADTKAQTDMDVARLNDTTLRRGQDLVADTSRANNTANATKDVTVSLLAPVTDGSTRFVPPAIADMYGLPATQTGVLSAQPDETIVAPDGRTVYGKTKPLGETEWKAAQGERLHQSGALTDEMLLNTILGDKAPVQAIGADGKPQYMSPGAAIRSGAEPYNPSADKSLIEGTAVVGNKSVQVFRKPSESTYVTADGQPLPADVQVFDKAKPTGTNEQLGMKPTEFTTKNGMFYNRAASAAANLDDLQGKKGYVPAARDFELMLGRTGDVLPLSLSNNLVSPEGRQFYNSAMNFMLSVLRPDTGAAFGREEFQNYARVFIPLPGDDPETLQNKKVARDTALTALAGSSAGAADQITRIMQANGVPVPPEMLARMQTAQQTAAAAVTTTAASEDPLTAARAAIAKGAPRDKVIERLRQHGINSEGL